MSDWKQRVRKLASDVLEVPQDATMDVPRIIMIGGSQVLIENYRFILEFSDQRMRLKLAKGEVVVEGQALTIRTILPDEVVIDGRVACVRYSDD